MPTYSIALDIGATKILGALIHGNKPIKKIKKLTGASGSKAKVLKNIKTVIDSLWLSNVKKIGVGIAAQVNPQNNLILTATNFADFNNFKLAEILKKQYHVPVTVDNDVKCFAQGELLFGWGRHYKNFLCLTFGTGIGGAIIIDKKLYRGQNNLAGEFGHMQIAGAWVGPAPTCGCGRKFCFESLAAGAAWHKLAKKYNEKTADKIVIANIAAGLANLVAIFNPEAIVLGGGLLEHKKLLEKLRQEFNTRVFHTTLKQTKLVKTQLGENAILLGTLN
jgi:predicted NBD/HSP70 family sugar kinase